MKYLFILLLFIGSNLQAHEKDDCGQLWTKTVKWFKTAESQQKFVDKLNKQQQWICGRWRSFEDMWYDEDAKNYSGYVSYWIKVEAK